MSSKIKVRFPIYPFVILFFSTLSGFSGFGQDSSVARPPVISDWKIYKAQAVQDSSKKMIELRSLIPRLVYDLRYAGIHNFMHRKMYPGRTSKTFLRLPAVLALVRVEKELNEKGLGLKIFDAYRPYSVTVKFWELVKDERYVANPAKGSGHNRGIAVDLTVINLKSGQELNMGTGFDNFTDSAHQTFVNLPPEILQNRFLLRSIMEKNGFKALDTEWWHYFLADGDRFELLDIDFKKLSKRL
ncbi:MAG: M15 family metallopeptidase [Bacteroidota bacterium]|nr:M15 family metallopeptidase [Bacteroidota bacterium]